MDSYLLTRKTYQVLNERKKINEKTKLHNSTDKGKVLKAFRIKNKTSQTDPI